MAAASAFRFKLGAVFPDFECDTGEEKFSFHEFLGRAPAWTVLFSFGQEFTPTSTLELGQCQQALEELGKLGVKVVGLASGGEESRKEWLADAWAASGIEAGAAGFPLILDGSGDLIKQLGLTDPQEARPVAGNAIFVIGPNKTLRLGTLFPASVGRSFVETLRVIRSLFITQDFVLATPANWKDGDRLIVAPGLPTDAAKEKFNNLVVEDLPSGKPYLRWVDCPDMREGFALPDGSAVPGDFYKAGESDFRIQLGAEFPDFECSTTKGSFSFHDFLDHKTRWSKLSAAAKGEWTVLFSHPKDFTPVCTTELSTTQRLVGQFNKRNVQLIGLSCDSVDSHGEWETDVMHVGGLGGTEFDFPLIADEDRAIASMLGMLDPLEREGTAPPMPSRALFLIDPNKRIAFTILYPATTGRNFEDILRVVDGVLLARAHAVAMPAEWRVGERILVHPDVSAEAAAALGEVEAKALPSGRGYLRFAACPAAPGVASSAPPEV